MSLNEIIDLKKRPNVGSAGCSEIDQGKAVLFHKVSSKTETAVGDKARGRPAVRGSEEVFVGHHFLEKWNHVVYNGGTDSSGLGTQAGVVVGEAVGDGPELEAGIGGEGGGDGGVLEEEAVVELGDDEGDVEVR